MQIEKLLGWRERSASYSAVSPLSAKARPTEPPMDGNNPIVFISYSWDSEEHKEWVLNLANRLVGDGVKVLLDRYDLSAGKSITHFVEKSFAEAHKVVVIFTPNYKLKADGRSGGVGYEYSIMNAALYKDQIGNDKFIPVLRQGTQIESIPAFMHQYIHLDVTNDEHFENSYIYNEPAIQRPMMGARPDFRSF
jgi:hypothetical protein